MAFKKGDPKPANSGRKKGTKNKNNLGVQERLEQKGINCIDEILEIARTTEDEQIRFQCYKELLKYVYPQRKAVEFTQEIELPVINIKGI
jgi:hypothetical protein